MLSDLSSGSEGIVGRRAGAATMARVMQTGQPPSHPPPLMLVAEGLTLRHGERVVFEDLGFTIGPGLSLVRGGDGRGKTSLLRLLAGTLQPTAGRLRGVPDAVLFEQPADPAQDQTVARAWLQAVARRHAHWNTARARHVAEAFGLHEHIDKPLFMLSTGSRRKLGLVAAAASGARLTLLDAPWAALDTASRRVLDGLLREAAANTVQAWVVADAAQPPGLSGVHWAGLIDLGD